MNSSSPGHKWIPTRTEVVSHLIVAMIAGAVTFPFSYLNGKDIGFAEGKSAAMSAAEGIAAATADKALSRITPALVAQQAQQLCTAQLAAKQEAFDTQLREGQRAATELAQSSCQNSDALESFYSIFRRYVQEGGTAAKKDPRYALQVADQLLTVRDAGRSALGQIAFGVLNGKVDELAAAKKSGDAKRVSELLIEIVSTLEVRDVAFKQALDTLRGLKKK